VFAYLVALLLPVTSRPVLPPLTALLVTQVTLYQTLRSAVRRVGAVVSGVLLAVALSSWVGFTWWTLDLTIAVALAVGYALHSGDSRSRGADQRDAHPVRRHPFRGHLADRRDPCGDGRGLVAGSSSPGRARSRPPRPSRSYAARWPACSQMADSLQDGSALERPDDWLVQARLLNARSGRVDDALRDAEESVRLNPRGLRLPYAAVSLRGRLEILEHAKPRSPSRRRQRR
jgi:Aromatic acid exporter family member 1